MKTWLHVEIRLERLHLPYRVQDEMLVSLDGRTVACTVQGARDVLAAPGHPDSKRQDRCKRIDLVRHGARILKRDGVLSCPARKISGRRERRDMQRRLAEERKEMARNVSLRLQGKGWMIPNKKPEVPVDAFAFQAYLQQLAETVMGTIHAH
jgi:hypothetical protein